MHRVGSGPDPLLGRDGSGNSFASRKRHKLGALVQGPAIAEDEIHGARDIAVPEVMAATVIVQRVLVPVESAPVKRRLVAADAQRHRLLRHRSGLLRRRRILCSTLPQSNPQTIYA